MKCGGDMIAVDTNLLVRYLTADDPRQFAQASALIRSDVVFVPITVVLETEWVLRSLYGFDSARIVQALRTLAGEPTIRLDQPQLVATALSWTEKGLQFADALHIAASSHCTAFVSFDRSLAKRAKQVAALPVRAP